MLSKFFSPDDPTTLNEILRILGRDRFASYLTDAGASRDRAVQLYAWNAALASAFLPAIAIVEVALRNALHAQLEPHFGSSWYDNPNFMRIDRQPFQRSIDRAKAHIVTGGKTITPPRMVAQLMFGFWVSLLRPVYARSLWPLLRPAFSSRTRRRRVTDALDPLVAFRNRVAHHEAIYDRNPTLMYTRLLAVAQMLSPELDRWIEHHSRVHLLLAKGPFSAPYTF